MRVVVALGGNALLRRGEPPTEDAQWRNVQIAAEAVAAIASRHETVVTHGNGPQVGLLALEAEAYKEVPPYGLDILGAESQGMVGFMLENALRNKLPNVPVATLLTSVVIDATDSALSRPTKPVGPVYDEAVARRLASDRGWTLAPDGEFFRRVVPSPLPQEILQLPAISALILAGIMVICAGGGGVPVRRGANGKFAGVEGVVDKDMTAALLAESLRAQWLLLLTDVPAVLADWGTPDARPISRSSPSDLRALDFAAGSMGPKVGAAAMGALSDAASLLTGEAGTIIADL